MNSVYIKFFTDNQAGEAASIQLKKLGLNVNQADIDEISSINPDPEKVTLIVVDIDSMPVSDIIDRFNSISKLHNVVKYIVLDSPLIVNAVDHRG